MPRWRCPISADTSFHLQKRCSQSFRRRAPEQPRPSHSPCLLNTPLHEWCFAPCPSVGQPVRNTFVSVENLLPTSTARTTNRARACPPTNSGYLRSLALLTARMATPSISAATSKSRTNAFVFTRPPAAALSNAKPRRLSTPARGHAARWWPKELRRRPHRHARPARRSC